MDAEIRQGSAIGIQASSQLSVEIVASGWAIVTLWGEQGLFESKRSRAALSAGIAACSGRLVVNYSEVAFGDSSLLGAFVGAVKVARLPVDSRAASVARAMVRSVCVAWGLGAVVDLAVGCVSELAANAARHVEWGSVPLGRRGVWLVVELFGPLLVVEVRDPSSVLPVVGEGIDFSWLQDAPGDVERLPECGMGLRLVVDQVEHVGGVFTAGRLPGGGKSVCFVVPCGVGA